ncbi:MULTISPECIES: hypothetical protein [unclassified Streptomyces]|uniref:hypothetical protein n=1 Tax=unclassified Streptomyces TaxID=2593676 RepID=UPI00236725DB|nr:MULTISPECIES: hypothetical protein [unclassified Streptomyces]MDF3149431.1 hypothetical protein [Streptomyces sp. T21Q-yed]WDF43933.1 hypothetical protein PBV52_47715 [Streptomyces sp. T12]
MIAVVGHADLTLPTLELVQAELKDRLGRLTEGAGGLVRAGAGLPVVFGRAVREAGRRLVVLLPTQRSVPAILPEPDRSAAAELLMLAEHVRLLGFDPADRNACITADERLVAASRKVLAVWDGSPTDGRDATAHLVAYARARGIPLEVVWPKGAARVSPGT